MKRTSLQKRLIEAKTIQDKLEVLDTCPNVFPFIEQNPTLKAFLAGLNPECELAIKAVIAIGQGPNVFGQIESLPDKFERLRELLQKLLKVEKFYDQVGGIVGYHFTILKLLEEEEKPANVHYHKPIGVDITNETSEVTEAVRFGIEALPKMGELYPVGGAGDRLDLRDEKTNEPLPAAELPFEGRSLIEGLIRDIQAKEHLYFKLFGEQFITPIALMTSLEKNNHNRITELFEKNRWFGRKKSSYFFFTQPLVPVVTEEGNWVMNGPLDLLLKPGGHGVIWKLAKDCGVFDWFDAQNRSKILIRQINNPLAATDYGLFAFTGVGIKEKKLFGFASCYRLLNTAEGMDALIEERRDEGTFYHIGNIEYTDFAKHGIADVAETPGSPYSAFPANTNILFADLSAIKEAVKIDSLPGLLLNMKAKVGGVVAGRLESAMQNISDVLLDSQPDDLKTYLTFNERTKTISVTKKSYDSSKSFVETPVGAFYDHLRNYEGHLREDCNVMLPPLGTEKEYLKQGPSFLLSFNPAIGPLYSVIAQKFRGGKLAKGAELKLELAEVDIENLNLTGSLFIEATNPLGDYEDEGILRYGDNSGKCTLQNVTIQNEGVDYSKDNCFWKQQIHRKESLRVHIEGNGEFFAKDVVFKGPFSIEVKEGTRVIASMKGENVHFRTEKISAPTWGWDYSFGADNAIVLKKWCLS